MISQQQSQKLENLVLEENNCPTVVLKSKKISYKNCQRKIMREFATSKPLLKNSKRRYITQKEIWDIRSNELKKEEEQIKM